MALLEEPALTDAEKIAIGKNIMEPRTLLSKIIFRREMGLILFMFLLPVIRVGKISTR